MIGTLVGVVLLAISSLQGAGFSIGVIVEFGCAVSQAFYFVAFRKWAVQKGRLPALISALVTGFMVGVALLCLFLSQSPCYTARRLELCGERLGSVHGGRGVV